ncbi:unnamed protein product [Prunus brigantina]
MTVIASNSSDCRALDKNSEMLSREDAVPEVFVDDINLEPIAHDDDKDEDFSDDDPLEEEYFFGYEEESQGDCLETLSKQRDTCGPTMGLGTCSMVNKSQTLVATMEIQNMFVNEIGSITRVNAPLNVNEWKKVTLE